LPKATQILTDIADFTLSGNGLVAFLIVLIILLINIGLPWIRGIYRKIPRKINNPPFIIRVGDFIKWHMPVFHWFEFNYSIMRVTGLIRIAINAGCPVNDAIKRAEDLDLNNCFRKRLTRWVTRVEQGQNISAAARDTGMGNSIAWAFDDKINAGNTPEILEMLEVFYRTSYNFKANLLRAIGLPCVILLLSVMVGFIVYAMYAPLVTIITFLTETAMP
jgi:type II secretory pathway component PulF